MNKTYPRLVQVGDATLLVFLDPHGDERSINTSRFDGVAPHKEKPGCSVVFVLANEDTGEYRTLPAGHPVEAFHTIGDDKENQNHE